MSANTRMVALLALVSLPHASLAQPTVPPPDAAAAVARTVLPGDSVRMRMGRSRWDGRVQGWFGDTLVVLSYGAAEAIPLRDLDVLAVRAPNAPVALMFGGIGGGLGALLGQRIGGLFRSCGSSCDDEPSAARTFAGGFLVGAAASVILDRWRPRFHVRYRRR